MPPVEKLHFSKKKRKEALVSTPRAFKRRLTHSKRRLLRKNEKKKKEKKSVISIDS